MRERNINHHKWKQRKAGTLSGWGILPILNFWDGHHMSAHIGALSSLSIIPLLIHLLQCPFKGATHLMLEHLGWTLRVTSKSWDFTGISLSAFWRWFSLPTTQLHGSEVPKPASKARNSQICGSITGGPPSSMINLEHQNTNEQGKCCTWGQGGWGLY